MSDLNEFAGVQDGRDISLWSAERRFHADRPRATRATTARRLSVPLMRTNRQRKQSTHLEPPRQPSPRVTLRLPCTAGLRGGHLRGFEATRPPCETPRASGRDAQTEPGEKETAKHTRVSSAEAGRVLLRDYRGDNRGVLKPPHIINGRDLGRSVSHGDVHPRRTPRAPHIARSPRRPRTRMNQPSFAAYAAPSPPIAQREFCCCEAVKTAVSGHFLAPGRCSGACRAHLSKFVMARQILSFI